MLPNPQVNADLVTFTEEILNGKLHFFVQCVFPCFIFLCSAFFRVFSLASQLLPFRLMEHTSKIVAETTSSVDDEKVYFLLYAEIFYLT